MNEIFLGYCNEATSQNGKHIRTLLASVSGAKTQVRIGELYIHSVELPGSNPLLIVLIVHNFRPNIDFKFLHVNKKSQQPPFSKISHGMMSSKSLTANIVGGGSEAGFWDREMNKVWAEC